MPFPPSPGQGPAPAAGGDPAGEGTSCLAALGRRLRQAREARGLAADTLAERLRLGVEQLEALETADRERLPEPVFVIAQLRRIATVLQLDISAELQALHSSGELRPGPRPGSSRSWQAADAGPPDGAPGDAATPCLRAGRARLLLVGGALLLALASVWGAGWLRSGGPVPHGSPGPSPSVAPAGRPAP